MSRVKTSWLVAIAALAMVAFFVRTVGLDAQSLWRDEVDALRFSTAPWSQMVGNFTRPGWNGPLYYVLLRGWIALTGTSEYAMRFFPLLFGVVCVPLTYRLGRRLFGPTVGGTAALLVSTSPYLAWYSQELKMYTLVLALSLLAIYSLRRALDGGGWHWWLVQVSATSLAFYSHILAALLIPVQVLMALVWWRGTRREWRGALISLACLTLPYLPLAAWQAPLALRARETGFYPYTLRQMVVILLNAWSAGIGSWGRPWITALMGLLAVAGVANAAVLPGARSDPAEGGPKNVGLRDVLVLVIWLAFPLLGVWLISLRQPLFTDRYLIWSTPAFYFLLAVALTAFARIGEWASWVPRSLLVVILVGNVINNWKQVSMPIKSDFRSAAAYVAQYAESATGDEDPPQEDELAGGGQLPVASAGPTAIEELVIFQIPYGRHTFDYYFPIESYAHADGLYTNHRSGGGGYAMTEGQAAQQMRAITSDHDATWLVSTEVSMWDERNLVQRWLDQNAHRVAEAHFNRVDVYRYELPDE